MTVLTAARANAMANAVGVATAAIGAALLVVPGASGPLMGLGQRGHARFVGAVDLVIAAGIFVGRPRWQWLAVRAAANLPTAAFAIWKARGTPHFRNAAVFGVIISTATIGDLTAVAAMRRQ